MIVAAYILIAWFALSVLLAVAFARGRTPDEPGRLFVDVDRVSWYVIDAPTNRESRRLWSTDRGWHAADDEDTAE